MVFVFPKHRYSFRESGNLAHSLLELSYLVGSRSRTPHLDRRTIKPKMNGNAMIQKLLNNTTAVKKLNESRLRKEGVVLDPK